MRRFARQQCLGEAELELVFAERKGELSARRLSGGEAPRREVRGGFGAEAMGRAR